MPHGILVEGHFESRIEVLANRIRVVAGITVNSQNETHPMNRNVLMFACVTCCLMISSIAYAAEQTITGKVTAIDAAKNSITVGDVVLDVSRKTMITVYGKKSTLADIKAEQSAKVKYDEGLETAISIDVLAIQLNHAPEVMNIEEINTDGPEMHPWLSEDGLTIYWAIWGQGVENWIWTAHRKTPQSLFEGKKRLFRGHSPVVTADGTELIFTSADSPQLMMAKRGAVEKEFERPTLIRELNFDDGDIPAARSISNDARTLYVLKKRPKDGIWDIWITHRKNRNVQWDVLERLQVSAKDNVRLSDPFVTPDHLHLYVTVVDDEDSKNVRIGILKRDDTSKPFSNLQLLDLNDAKGKLPNCSAPRYVSATHELFVSSAKLFRSEEQTKKRGFDLWVIKVFDPSFGQ